MISDLKIPRMMTVARVFTIASLLFAALTGGLRLSGTRCRSFQYGLAPIGWVLIAMPMVAARAWAEPQLEQALLTIHVLTPERVGVPGAVVAIDADGRRLVLSSGDNGIATTRLAPGTYGLVVSKFGYLTTRTPVQLSSSGLSRDVTLSPASAISGRAMLAGSPVAGVTVSATCLSETPGHSTTSSTVTDDRGEYHLADVPARTICNLRGRARQSRVIVSSPAGSVAVGDRPNLQVDLRLEMIDGSVPVSPSDPTEHGEVRTTVNGLAVEASGRRPVPLASIRIYDEVAHAVRTAATTDLQGRFRLVLSPGQYRLSASRLDFDVDPVWSGAPVSVPEHSQQRALSLELPLRRGAVIAGRVLHTSGEPVVGAKVQVYRNRSVAGHLRPLVVVTNGATSTTDENGQFRIYGLSAGTYLISATQSGYQAQTRWRQYYPGGAIASAQPVELSPSAVLTGIDLIWAPAQEAGAIHGTVNSGDGAFATNVSVTATPSTQSSLPMSAGEPVPVDKSGRFTIAGLEEGSYVLKVAAISSDGGSSFGFARTSVISGAISDVTITVVRASTIVGRAVTRGADGSLRPAPQVVIGAFPVDLDEYPDRGYGDRLPTAETDADGLFKLRLIGGSVVFRVATVASGWFVRAVSSDGRDVTDVGLAAVSRPTSIVVELARQISSVRGTVRAKEGRPEIGMSVVFLSTDPSRVRRWSRYTAVVPCDTDGKWSYKGLPPGQYFAFPVSQLPAEEVDFEDPDWLQRHLPKAKLVDILEDSATQVDLEFSGDR